MLKLDIPSFCNWIIIQNIFKFLVEQINLHLHYKGFITIHFMPS